MRRLVPAAAALALAAGSVLLSAGAAHADSGVSLSVTGDGSKVAISRDSVHAGRVSFSVSSTASPDKGGSDIVLWRPSGSATVKQVLGDLKDEFASTPATAAKGTRELTRDARFYGLADVAKGDPVTVTEWLNPGTYYLMDIGALANGAPQSEPPTLTTLHIKGSANGNGRLGNYSATVRLTSADRFQVSGHLPSHGSVLVRNVSDTIHFMSITPVKKGTTDADIQKIFNAPPSSAPSGPPPFVDTTRPSAGADVQSPGRSLRLTYSLPPGRYVLLCFVSDDKTGMPHAIMGMHKVVELS